MTWFKRCSEGGGRGTGRHFPFEWLFGIPWHGWTIQLYLDILLKRISTGALLVLNSMLGSPLKSVGGNYLIKAQKVRTWVLNLHCTEELVRQDALRRQKHVWRVLLTADMWDCVWVSSPTLPTQSSPNRFPSHSSGQKEISFPTFRNSDPECRRSCKRWGLPASSFTSAESLDKSPDLSGSISLSAKWTSKWSSPLGCAELTLFRVKATSECKQP